jgi:hypothetical protein
MTQPIAGVAPSALKEVTVMSVWPSISAGSLGRVLGRMYDFDAGFRLFGVPITIGRMIALLSIPIVLVLYFNKIVPRIPFVVFGWSNPACRRYRLTNRRVVVDNPFTKLEEKGISLDRFDSIEVDQLPGQRWYKAGDLIFKNGPVETFRLAGVSRPETFRHTCLKAQLSYAGVQKARDIGAAV